MGSTLCKSSAQKQSSTLSLRDRNTCMSNKKSIFYPLQNTCFTQDNDFPEQQERSTPDVRHEAPIVTSKESSTRLRRKNRRSVSEKKKLYDQTMDDATPLIEGMKENTSDFPSSNETLQQMKRDDSVEQLTSGRIIDNGDIDNSVPDNTKDDIVPMTCHEDDSRSFEGTSRSITRICDRRNKRRASKSPVLSSESFNVKDIPTRPNAPVPPFSSDEFSVSPTTSLRAHSGASRDPDISHNIPNLHEKTDPGRKAKAASKTDPGSSEGEVTEPCIPSVFRLLSSPIAISGQPKQRPLRATAPIFVPKPVHMVYPSSFTPIKADPMQMVNQYTQPKAGSDRIVRLDPNATGFQVSPSLGLGRSSRPRAREMYHWSPSMSTAFQVPQFTSWKMMSEPCDPRRLGLSVDTSAPVSLEQHVMQPLHLQHPVVQRARAALIHGSAGNSNKGDKTSKQRPMPHGAVQATSVLARKSPQVRGGITSASQVIGSRSTVFHYKGTKITMIDERRKIFVIDLLSKETCELIQTVSRVPALPSSVLNLFSKF